MLEPPAPAVHFLARRTPLSQTRTHDLMLPAGLTLAELVEVSGFALPPPAAGTFQEVKLVRRYGDGGGPTGR